jgi:hypothetical protein
MILNVKHAATPGRYRLEMQWTSTTGASSGAMRWGDTIIVFERNGVRETLRPTGGDATGLKYLARKTECLTVKAGEGYCKT